MCVSRPTCWNPKSRTPGTCHATGRLNSFGLACLSDISSGKKLAASRGDALMEAHCMNERMNSDCCSCRTMQLCRRLGIRPQTCASYSGRYSPGVRGGNNPARCEHQPSVAYISLTRWVLSPKVATKHDYMDKQHFLLVPHDILPPTSPKVPPMQCGGYLPCPHTTCMWSGAGLAALYSRGQARTQPRTHHFMPQHGTIHT